MIETNFSFINYEQEVDFFTHNSWTDLNGPAKKTCGVHLFIGTCYIKHLCEMFLKYSQVHKSIFNWSAVVVVIIW
jgi:hypothetical protein